MFYNLNTNELLSTCPPNGYLPPSGSLVQGLDICDFDTQKACGILPVKSDLPPQPINTIENIIERQIVIEEDGVIVNRSWIPAPTIVPDNISARQVRLWLINNGIPLSQVDIAIDTISDPLLKEQTKVEWEYAPYIERNHPLIDSLAQHLGLTPEQIDEGFVIASQL